MSDVCFACYIYSREPKQNRRLQLNRKQQQNIWRLRREWGKRERVEDVKDWMCREIGFLGHSEWKQDYREKKKINTPPMEVYISGLGGWERGVSSFRNCKLICTGLRPLLLLYPWLRTYTNDITILWSIFSLYILTFLKVSFVIPCSY